MMEEIDHVEEREDAEDPENQIEKFAKENVKIPIWKLWAAVFIMAVFVFAMIFLCIKARKIGEKVGKLSGNLVGTTVGIAVGSFEGYPEGREKGKEDGLSAVDTIAEMQSSFQEVANLEVLVSSVKLNDYHKLENKYAALYLLKGDAVFTVDLSKASIDANEDGKILYIRIPQPEATIYIDERYTQKVAEYQRKFFNGSAEDGFNAYMNSMSNLEIKAKEAIEEDESLMKCARDSAEKQIKRLAKLVLVNGEEPLIVWE